MNAERAPSFNPHTRAAGYGVVLVVAYVLTALASLNGDPVGPFTAILWPPAGLALAAVLLLGPRLAIAVFLADVLVFLWRGAAPPFTIIHAMTATAEAVLGSFLLRRSGAFELTFSTVRSAVVFVALAAVVACAAVTPGALATSVVYDLRGATAYETWRAWVVGDAIGITVIVPAVLCWWTVPRREHDVVETILLFSAVIVTAVLIFGPVSPSLWIFQRPYFAFPLVLFVTRRLQVRGAATSTLLLSAIAIWCTLRGFGLFGADPAREGAIELQTYIGVFAATQLLFGALVTERMRARAEYEDLLRREHDVRAAVEREVKLRDDLLAIVSHDLKNPLAAILLNVDAIQRSLEDKDAKVATRVGAMKRAAERMNGLIKSLLDIARIEAGDLVIQKTPHDIRALIIDAVEELTPLASARKIALRIHAVDGAALVAPCDRERVMQVLGNIIGNAVKFSPDGGKIELHAARRDDNVTVAVRDEGPGIPEQTRIHVFERYWRDTTQPNAGSGLGLFIARAIVEGHGGTITVDSAPGGGSTFAFTLPL